MTCTVKKCWPDKVTECECNGDLKRLSDIADSPEVFLKSKFAWAQTRSENPEFMWQVLLSQVTFSTFSTDEISSFTICSGHEVKFIHLIKCIHHNIFQEAMMHKFYIKNLCCFVCNSKTGIRRVTFQLHKKLCRVIPIGAGIFNL